MLNLHILPVINFSLEYIDLFYKRLLQLSATNLINNSYIILLNYEMISKAIAYKNFQGAYKSQSLKLGAQAVTCMVT